MKTHKGLKGRLKVTGAGKVLHKRTGNRHLMSHKTSKRSRQLRGWRELSMGERRKLRRQYHFG